MENPSSAPPPSAIGSQMVSEALGASLRQLDRLHPANSPEDVLAQLVYMAARHLDHLHERFTDAAQYAASTLTGVATGKTSINSLGVLQNNGTQVDILAARRADAVEHLKAVIHAYRQVAAADHTAPHSARRPAIAPIPPAAAGATPVHPARSR
ncbi:hypothetical protein ACFWPU_10065 [Streptomyces sp. NPDC058471]|uniref:hypothetical protein n=1 Tax=Streptomyces sp. NPDC058471 TaxID=3346516 RepID=UPI00365E0365